MLKNVIVRYIKKTLRQMSSGVSKKFLTPRILPILNDKPIQVIYLTNSWPNSVALEPVAIYYHIDGEENLPRIIFLSQRFQKKTKKNII